MAMPPGTPPPEDGITSKVTVFALVIVLRVFLVVVEYVMNESPPFHPLLPVSVHPRSGRVD